jgi:hypothetical protein
VLLTDATAINVGTGAVSAVYVGSTQVWAPPAVGFAAFNPATLDDFARAAGALGADWTSPWSNSTGTISITSTSGRTTGSSAGTVSSSAIYKTSFAANQDVALTVPVVDATTGVFIQVTVRGSVSANTTTTSQYFLRVTPSSSTFNIRKAVSGGASSSLASFTQAIASGSAIGLRATGSTTTTLTAYHKPSGGSWTQVGTIDDTASPITGTGFIGFTLQGTANRGGVFAGGAVT